MVDEVTNISAQLAQLLRKMADALQPDVVPAAAVPSSAPPVPVGQAPALVALRQRYPAAPEAWLQALAERSAAPALQPVAPVQPQAAVTAFPDVGEPAVTPAPDYPAQKRSARPRPVFADLSPKQADPPEFAKALPASPEDVQFQSARPTPQSALSFPDAPKTQVPQAADYALPDEHVPNTSDWPVVADRPEAGGPVFPARLTNPKREHSFPEPAPQPPSTLDWPEPVAAKPHAVSYAEPQVQRSATAVFPDRNTAALTSVDFGNRVPVEPAKPHFDQTRPLWPQAPESAIATQDADVATPRRTGFARARPEQEVRQWSA
jgi:hypothetical protein